ncbi:hypothetical protein [Ectopseudomonas guguanensis]|jgi:hypothetical protein|uniref:hypothetical protein n=1 Tax=Ectopseudomonas guguanensis TaxID=1198456 RepID=UPI0012D6031D|nr:MULTISPECIES: hypothetical protein [Pseudomonas]MPT18272.1 hypothetical protein [Pseudomonas sp.]WJH56303.1 hypothetical protein FE254_09005 [Pseudomonas guguanensis]
MKTSRIITSETHGAQHEQQAELMIFGTPKERLDFYRREIQYETSLLAGRTNAYLTAQSFLVIAYASSMANSNEDWGAVFTLVVPALFTLLGIISSLHAWPGIRASATIIEHWHYKQEQLLRSDPEFGHAYDDSPLFSEQEASRESTYKSLLFFLRSPWLFIVFWSALGVFSIWLQLPSANL